MVDLKKKRYFIVVFLSITMLLILTVSVLAETTTWSALDDGVNNDVNGMAVHGQRWTAGWIIMSTP